MNYEGQCFCGAIRYQVSGDPLFAGYCHCQDCRDWGGGTILPFTLFPWDAFEITQGEQHLKIGGRVPETPRAWCDLCGGHVGALRSEADPPHAGVGPYTLNGFEFKPTMHVFCDEGVLTHDDDLPHYRNLPSELGGSGELVPSTST